MYLEKYSMKNFFKRHPIRASIEALFLVLSYAWIVVELAPNTLETIIQVGPVVTVFMAIPVVLTIASPLLLVILVNTIISLFRSETSIREECANSSTSK